MEKGSMGRCATCAHAVILVLALRPGVVPEVSLVGDREVWCSEMHRRLTDLIPPVTMVQDCSAWRDRKRSGSGRARPS